MLLKQTKCYPALFSRIEVSISGPISGCSFHGAAVPFSGYCAFTRQSCCSFHLHLQFHAAHNEQQDEDFYSITLLVLLDFISSNQQNLCAIQSL